MSRTGLKTSVRGWFSAKNELYVFLHGLPFNSPNLFLVVLLWWSYFGDLFFGVPIRFFIFGSTCNNMESNFFALKELPASKRPGVLWGFGRFMASGAGSLQASTNPFPILYYL